MTRAGRRTTSAALIIEYYGGFGGYRRSAGIASASSSKGGCQLRRHKRGACDGSPLQAAATEVAEEDGVVFEDGVFEDGVFVAKPLPAITLKAVVLDLGAKTEEGAIVLAVREPFFDILKMLEHEPSIAHEIDWRKWEEIIAGAWERSKLFDEVILTPRSGDKGRDVIATKWGGYSIRIFDQVKAYNPGLLVPEDEVVRMLGMLDRDRNVSKGYITTTSNFAPGVWKDEDLKRYMPHRLELTNGEKLLAWLADPSRKRS